VLARALAAAPGSLAVLRNAHAGLAQEQQPARPNVAPRPATNDPPLAVAWEEPCST
jgi:hypothetical protein